MNLSVLKKPLILLVTIAAFFMLPGCASNGGSSDYSYQSSDEKYDAMAKESMDEATKSLSAEDIENLNKLGK